MKYVFGPVPSRRLGRSLGIDPLPHKTCNWNCVYCQLGRTQPLVNQRGDYCPVADILAEVERALGEHQAGEIDWMTLVGSGEPVLYASTGRLIRGLKNLTDLPVAVITNGSLLHLPEVRRELSLADAVLPSLDAGTPELYRQINRPHPDSTFEHLVEGMVALRREFPGKLWVEVMLVRGLNDTSTALGDIAAVLQRIRPDEVHISLPTRPPAETWVQPASEEGLLRARAILGEVAQVLHPAQVDFDLGAYGSVVDAVTAIVRRHPMRQDELIRAMSRWSIGQVKQALADLQASGQIQVVERYGVPFWSAASARYPDEEHSKRTEPAVVRRRQRRDHRNRMK